MDCASSEFYNKEDGKYHLDGEGTVKTEDEMIDWLEELVNKYPIISIEDGLDENDWEGWAKLTERLGKKVQLSFTLWPIIASPTGDSLEIYPSSGFDSAVPTILYSTSSSNSSS